MKQSSATITLLLIVFAIYWSFHSLMPDYETNIANEKIAFSTDRALKHIKRIAQKPHAVGFPAHAEVRNYIVTELESMGLETSLQEGYTAGDWGNLSKAINIVARVKGSDSGKALMLLSHYDSNPHSSLGASDASSGVATILEGIRAYLEKNNTPKNDIIILISDAEELGLNGASLFVNSHPWAKDVGLVLNFEARGSGGPSYMLIETNRGNAALVKEFTKAKTAFPVANSLAYSIYKMLPNDTDLTVFRTDRDIDGFNFAFIDDHYDYHTAKDTYERLDRNTLMHQGSYLMPLLLHFSQADLSTLKSLNDVVYFNVPFFKLISYPFEWIWFMFGFASLCFVVLLIHGLRKNTLTITGVTKGFIPMLLALVVNGVVGYFSWSVLQWLYPGYKDILHGFTYNGHTYIIAFTLFAIGVCFYMYHRFKKITTPNLLVAPIFLWLLICALVGAYLPGASFFIIPVFALLASFLVVVNQKMPNPYLLVFLVLPALFIYAPLIQMFPIGLGLKMMVATTVLTTLTFVLLLPVFGFYKRKMRLANWSIFLFLVCIAYAHFNAGFSKENPKPTSLLYVLDTDTNKAQWATYEKSLSDWTTQYIDDTKKTPKKLAKRTISSKYASNFTYVADAPLKKIKQMQIEKTRDTTVGDHRFLELCITPKRAVNRLDIFSPTAITAAEVNSVKLSDFYLKNRKRNKLITHYISNNDYTDLQLTIPKDAVLELTLYETSNNLLHNDKFTVPARPEHDIPMPFVLNDAVLVTKTIRFE